MASKYRSLCSIGLWYSFKLCWCFVVKVVIWVVREYAFDIKQLKYPTDLDTQTGRNVVKCVIYSFSGMVYIVLVVATGLGLDPGELSMDLDLKR